MGLWFYFSLRYAAKMVLELLGWFSAFVLRYGSIQRELWVLPSFERHSLVFINRMLKSEFFLYFSGFFSYSLPNSILFLSSLPVSSSIKVILDVSWFLAHTINVTFQVSGITPHAPHCFYITLSQAFAYPAAALVLHGTATCPNSVCSELFLVFQK